MLGIGVLTGSFFPVAFMGVARARDNYQLAMCDAPSAEDRGWRPVAQTTIIPHAHSEGHDHWKLRSGASVARCA